MKSRGLLGPEGPLNCILKPENVSPSCKDIIVSMLWGVNIFFPTLMRACFDFLGQKTGRGGPPNDTALRCLAHLDAS